MVSETQNNNYNNNNDDNRDYEIPFVQNVDVTTDESPQWCLHVPALSVCLSAFLAGLGLSSIGCDISTTTMTSLLNPYLFSKDENKSLLRGMKQIRPKTWGDYTAEMVKYINKNANTRRGSSLSTTNRLSNLISGSFTHFSESDHHQLATLLPKEVTNWGDVHWTIAYSQFMKIFSRDVNDETKVLERFKEYRSNGEKVYSHNQRTSQFAEEGSPVEYRYTLELNQFADMSREEFIQSGLVAPVRPRNDPRQMVVTDEEEKMTQLWEEMPLQFDWRDHGCVQKVKNQKYCGSCWAFSAVEAVESAVCVSRKKRSGLWTIGPVSPDADDEDHSSSYEISKDMPNLSEQQLVDCSREQGNGGCNGGMMEFAFEYMKSNSTGELCDEESYPYTGRDTDQCREQTCSYDRDWKVISWKSVKKFSQSALQNAIWSNGAVAVSAEADEDMFRLYSGGVLHDGKISEEDENTDVCGNQLNHGLAAVGWGIDTATEEPYWIIKNSWGESWGEGGFIRMARDTGGSLGECGLLMENSYPVVKSYKYPSW